MFLGKPILAFDCIYNRATTHSKVHYFKDSDELKELACQKHNDGATVKQIAEAYYTWKIIAQQYEALC